MLKRSYCGTKNQLFFQPRLKSDETYWKSTNRRTLRNIKDCLIYSNKRSFVSDEIWERDVNVSATSERSKQIKFKAYDNFLKPDKTDDERITWPSKYLDRIPKIKKEISAEQRGQKLVDKASVDFAKWAVENLYFEPVESDVEECAKKIKEIFRDDLDRHVMNAIDVKIEEIPCVPEQIVEYLQQYNSSVLVNLERYLKLDVKAEAMPKKYIGFGTILPKDLSYYPLNNRTKERWIDAIYFQYNIESMKPLWKGIENLQITQDFYKWLSINRKGDVPSYLASYYDVQEKPEIKPKTRKSRRSRLWLPIVKKLNLPDIKTMQTSALDVY